MPTNLTGSTIADTFDQLLHVNDGPEATEKIVYSGTGVATALKVGTQSVSVDNLKLDGNTISSTDTDGNINITPNGTGSVNVTNLVLAAGSITADNIKIDGNTISSEDTNGDINLTPNGTGSVVVSKINVTAGAIPYSVLNGRAYAAFCDVTDQTGSVSAATAVKFGTTDIAGSGITMVSDGTNLTRLTFAVAGTYMVAPNLQLTNTDGNDHDATIWFALDGTNIPRSTTRITVPKATDGGNAFFQIVFYVTVTAGQHIQVMWLPENVAVRLEHTAAVTGPPAVPAIPSAIISAERIA
jgi:hypothetical protein